MQKPEAPKRQLWELQSMQAAPLSLKITLTKVRIREWVNEFGEDGVYVAFSGGKDSTVLLDIARQLYPNMKAYFVNTGLEFPEIVDHVKTYDNVDIVRPRYNFKQVIEHYGYPFISKEVSGIVGGGQRALRLLASEGYDINNRTVVVEECKKRLKKQRGEWRRLAQCYNAITKNNEVKEELTADEKGMYSTIPDKYKFILKAPFQISDLCCREMKKTPAHKYMKETGRVQITAQMAEESRLRRHQWLKYGCNAFDTANPTSNPMSFWTEQDVLQYIKQHRLPIASVYGEIVSKDEDGMLYESSFCEMPLKTTGQKRTGCMFCGFGCHLEKPGEGRFERMKLTHPKQYQWIMKPWKDGGLGYQEVIDWLNEHGNLDIRY